jgi:transcriptional regulator with XRE-family HTH domain
MTCRPHMPSPADRQLLNTVVDETRELRRRMRAARRATKFTQDDVAREIGVSRQTISNWERVATNPSLVEFAKLCSLYGVSSDQILFGVTSVQLGAYWPAGSKEPKSS